VWIFESAHLGYRQLFSTSVSNVAHFFQMLLAVGRFPVTLLGAVVLLGFVSRAPIVLIFTQRRVVFMAITVTTISCLLFFYLVGFYQERLAFNVVPPLILSAAIVALGIVDTTRLQSVWGVITAVAWTIAITKIAFEITKSGPYG
jgi:hypothetical protein